LAKEIPRFEPAHQSSAEVPNHGAKHILLLQRVSCGHRDSFLPEAGIKSSHDFTLAVKVPQSFIDAAVETQKIIKLMQPILRKDALLV
jgi:hypothetical protein